VSRLVLGLGLVATASSSPLGAAHSTWAAGSVALSVSVARGVYPRDALVRVHMQLINHLQRSVQVVAHCPTGYMEADALNKVGNVTFPPLFEEGMGPTIGCKAGIHRSLGPGQALRESQLIILRSRRVDAVATVKIGSETQTVTSHVLGLRLTAPVAPQVALTTTPAVAAEIRGRTPKQRGTLWYQATGWCASDSGQAGGMGRGYATITWQSMGRGEQKKYTLSPDCSTPVPSQWHVIAGWLNQTVATIDYPQG
jgi:hypothetical protein